MERLHLDLLDMPDLDDLKPYELFVGDLDSLTFVVRDDDGEPVDLAGWTAVGGTIRFQHVVTNAVVVGVGTLSIPDAENGEVNYAWAAGDATALVEGLYDVFARMDTTGASRFRTLQWSRQLLMNRLPAP